MMRTKNVLWQCPWLLIIQWNVFYNIINRVDWVSGESKSSEGLRNIRSKGKIRGIDEKWIKFIGGGR